MNKVFGLVDCNNFYASCERLFAPELKHKPIVVLSNNDGCVIARSNEAKPYVAMGEPYFKLKPLIKEHGILVRSSNYALYGDISNRVMNVLSEFTPVSEIYSIDECFLDLSGFHGRDLTQYAWDIKHTVQKYTGIPVGVGIGSTKTLAKIANRIAKKSAKANGVLDLYQSPYLDHALKITDIGEVWGIGRRYAKMLKENHILTAFDFKQADPRWIRQRMSVVGLRTHQELNGTSCIELEDQPADKQTTAVTRSFGEMLTTFEELKAAIQTFSARASEKIRKAELVTNRVCVFIRTNPFRSDQPQYSNSVTIELFPHTNDLRLIQQAAISGLKRIYRENHSYKKAGVHLLDLMRPENVPKDLFSLQQAPVPDKLMSSIDYLNGKYGGNLVSLGQTRKNKSWYATRDHCSPHYTTNWADLKWVK